MTEDGNGRVKTVLEAISQSYSKEKQRFTKKQCIFSTLNIEFPADHADFFKLLSRLKGEIA